MAIVFFYVQVAYGTLEVASNFWRERKSAEERLKKGETESSENENRPAKVAPPKTENALLAQLPALEQNILRTTISKPEQFGASAIDYTILSGERKRAVSDDVKKLPPWFQNVPLSYVNLSDLYIPPQWKSDDLMVIHVQDAHENYEAQKNIARILESLASGEKKQLAGGSQGNILPSRPLMIVGVEGARGEFDFTPYRTFPNKEISRGVVEHMLKESLISGPEFVGMTLGVDPETEDLALAEPPVLFWGIEEEKLYLDHVQAFKDSMPIEKEAKEIQKRLSDYANRMKEKLFNPNLKDLDSSIQQYQQGTIRLGPYLKILTWDGVPSSFVMIRNFLNALDLEETLNYDRVEKERRDLTNDLIEKISKQELKNLMSASLSYRLGNLTYGMFYRYLLDVCKAYGVRLGQWPEMDKYIRYVLISDGIKSQELFAELEELEKRRVEHLLLNPIEKSLVQLSQDLILVEKLFGYRLSPTDWERYQKRREEIRSIPKRLEDLMRIAEIRNGDKQISKLEQFLKPFENFNEAAISRNDVLVGNLLNKFKSLNPKSSSVTSRIAVLIAGGFHTQGMTQILREKKVAYAVLTPRLGKVDGKGTEYLDIFRRDKTPLEKLFTNEKITLS
ncbi:MAG: hypothetical protein HYS58_02965, partial [Elusimicrobia bacterium]|nr:hypothetical protein [Elusimicrobiota bacterium]